MSEKRPCVYILASKRNGTLYTGVTSDIVRRAWQHRSNAVDGFVRDYGVHRLVFVEFLRDHGRCDPPRQTHQEMAACVETGVDRAP